MKRISCCILMASVISGVLVAVGPQSAVAETYRWRLGTTVQAKSLSWYTSGGLPKIKGTEVVVGFNKVAPTTIWARSGASTQARGYGLEATVLHSARKAKSYGRWQWNPYPNEKTPVTMRISYLGLVQSGGGMSAPLSVREEASEDLTLLQSTPRTEDRPRTAHRQELGALVDVSSLRRLSSDGDVTYFVGVDSAGDVSLVSQTPDDVLAVVKSPRAMFAEYGIGSAVSSNGHAADPVYLLPDNAVPEASVDADRLTANLYQVPTDSDPTGEESLGVLIDSATLH